MNVDDLNNTFVTADTHFGHTNIIKFCDRPFESVDEMDRVLIDNHNKVVGSNDIVWHLGDVTLGNFDMARGYFKQLNGKIQVLANHWHHDKRWLPKNYLGPMVLEYPDFVSDIGHVNIVPPMVVLEIEGMGNEGRPLAITLCHYPLAVWDRKHYGGVHCFAHCHSNFSGGEKAIDVGVDNIFKVWGKYRPVRLSEVMDHLV